MFAIIIRQNEKIIGKEIIESLEQPIKATLFEGEKYQFEIYNAKGELLSKEETIAKKNGITLKLKPIEIDKKKVDTETIIKYIKQLTSSAKFDEQLEQKINLIKFIDPKWEFNEDLIRGGRLEQLVNHLLLEAKYKEIIDHVEWSGKIREFDLAYPTSGKPDFIVDSNNVRIILEVTVIHGVRRQWAAEGASVPDHIRTVLELDRSKKIIGIFSAPSIHSELERNLKRHAEVEKIPMLCMTLDELIQLIADTGSREEFKRIIIAKAEEQLNDTLN